MGAASLKGDVSNFRTAISGELGLLGELRTQERKRHININLFGR